MKVKVFGLLTGVLKCSEIEFDFVSDVKTFKNLLNEKYPELKNQKFQIVVNAERITENKLLTKNDEIALLPAFSGG